MITRSDNGVANGVADDGASLRGSLNAPVRKFAYALLRCGSSSSSAANAKAESNDIFRFTALR